MRLRSVREVFRPSIERHAGLMRTYRGALFVGMRWQLRTQRGTNLTQVVAVQCRPICHVQEGAEVDSAGHSVVTRFPFGWFRWRTETRYLRSKSPLPSWLTRYESNENSVPICRRSATVLRERLYAVTSVRVALVVIYWPWRPAERTMASSVLSSAAPFEASL